MVSQRDMARDAADGGIQCCRVGLQRRHRRAAARVRGRILLVYNRVSRNSALWWRVSFIGRRQAPRLDGVSRVCDVAGALGPDLGDCSAERAGVPGLCGVRTVGHPTLGRSRTDQGLLPSYYAFPYMFASFWPLVGLFIARRDASESRWILEPICGFALLTAASFVPSPYQGNPAHIELPAGFLALPSEARQASTDQALTQLGQATMLGRVAVDESVLALTPEFYRAEEVLSVTAERDFDSVIYFAHGFQSLFARETAAVAGLDHLYKVPGTEIRVATKRPVTWLSGLPLSLTTD